MGTPLNSRLSFLLCTWNMMCKYVIYERITRSNLDFWSFIFRRLFLPCICWYFCCNRNVVKSDALRLADYYYMSGSNCCINDDANVSNNYRATVDSMHIAGIILGMGSANERRYYNVTSSVIGWAHTQNDPGIVIENEFALRKRYFHFVHPEAIPV